ncbi:hypothetical protein DTW89_15180 [Acidovorax sp. BoFeN1]|uniref:hypothetical protein n=1 Tax=Acidovorax sp. BoFeN1 TaxID=1231053 RepID=UPI000E08F0B2|nr:hypothetical protein [Acidovorax sp. BoFeN1]RDD91988.1 hypothetical protein DTW89_15180 [Acidovorax sp. BoFeN1]
MLLHPDHCLPIQKPAHQASVAALLCTIAFSAASGAATAAADELQALPQTWSIYVEAGYTDHGGPACAHAPWVCACPCSIRGGKGASARTWMCI